MRATVAKLWVSALALCLALPAMAAGDVWAELSKKGDLKITGTDEGNQIMVTNDGFGNVRVVGMPATGTTVRGGAEWTFLETDANTVAGKLEINLKNGDNYLEIDGIDVAGDLKIKLGNGDGTIGVFDADFFDDVSFKMGKGTNLVTVVNVSVGDKLSLKLGGDADGIWVASTASFFDSVKISGGQGTDTQTVAPTTTLNAKTKSIETFLTDPTTDALCDDIATALTTEYVARGGDPADISCP